jgi:hypothetical protein
MQTRLILFFLAAALVFDTTCSVENVGHVTRDSMSARLVLVLACGQKPQLAKHLPS